MRSIKKQLVLTAKRLSQATTLKKIPARRLLADVPYFSQWESPRLAQKIIEGSMDGADDPRWKASGARTRQEYAAWSWNGCGMACLKMILAKHSPPPIPLVTLGKKCAEYGGYELPLDKSSGLFYKPFAAFVQAEYGLAARPVAAMTKQDIMNALAAGDVVIASVSPQIRDVRNSPAQKGGHLILMLGYDTSAQTFTFHNPSGFTKQTREYVVMSFKNFDRFFANRGILISLS